MFQVIQGGKAMDGSSLKESYDWYALLVGDPKKMEPLAKRSPPMFIVPILKDAFDLSSEQSLEAVLGVISALSSNVVYTGEKSDVLSRFEYAAVSLGAVTAGSDSPYSFKRSSSEIESKELSVINLVRKDGEDLNNMVPILVSVFGMDLDEAECKVRMAMEHGQTEIFKCPREQAEILAARVEESLNNLNNDKGPQGSVIRFP